LSVGVCSLSAVGRVVDSVNVTSNISGRSSCRGRTRSSSGLCSKLGSIRTGDVSVGTSDDNVKAITELAEVVGVVGSDGTTPEDTLDVYSACRVVASKDRRIILRISLEVDVERVATTHAGALLSTSSNIVRAHESVASVLVSRVGSSQVAEGLDISDGKSSGDGLDTVPRIGSKGSSIVRDRNVTDTERLLNTRTITLDHSSGRGCVSAGRGSSGAG